MQLRFVMQLVVVAVSIGILSLAWAEDAVIIELAERKYALGRTPQAQVLQAQTQLAKLEEQRVNLTSLLQRQQELLKGVLGYPTDFNPSNLALTLNYPLPTEVAFDDEVLLDSALGLRPDNRRLDILEEQQDMQVELAHRSYRPDYTVSASYGIRDGKRDLLSAGVSFPLFTHKAERQDAALQEAYASLDMTASNRDLLANALATELGTMRVELHRIVENSRLYRDALVPQARLTLNSTIAGYAANQVDLAELLKAQQTLLSYELELEQLAIEYLAALSELQVLTAGAFDPLPYLAGDSAAHDRAAEDIAVELNLLAITAESIAATTLPLVSNDTGMAVPRLNPQFIESLELPVSEVDETADAGDDSADATADDFYVPFQQAAKDNEDE